MRNGCRDRFEHALSIRHDLMIVEPQDAVALGCEKGTAPCITLHLLRLEMLSAIDLDNEVRLVTDEINNKWTDRSLSSKARAAKSMGADSIPNDPLGLGHVASQRARAGSLSR